MPRIYVLHENEEWTGPLKAQLRRLTERFPELGWSDPGDSIRVPRALAARMILAQRHGVQPNRVKKALEKIRQEL